MERITRADVHGLAEKAAREYRLSMESISKLQGREIFNKAEDCYRAGYERALLDYLPEETF